MEPLTLIFLMFASAMFGATLMMIFLDSYVIRPAFKGWRESLDGWKDALNELKRRDEPTA